MRIFVGLLVLLAASAASSRTITVGPGTALFGELEERVTSRVKKDGTDVGDVVRAHVWRDVVVDGQLVFKAGSPMLVRVSEVKKAKLAGIKGKLELEAVSATTTDGQQILLDGGYDKSGRGRMGLSISLAAVVAWPLIFIRGKPAILDSGTVFDCSVRSQFTMQSTRGDGPTHVVRIDDGSSTDLTAAILYDSMNPDDKLKLLPMELRQCGAPFTSCAIIAVNEKPVDPLPMEVASTRQEDGCTLVRANVDLKALGKHLAKGINRFVVKSGDATVEVLLEVEL